MNLIIRPMVIPDITSGERTEIVYGIENVTKFSAYGLSIIEKSLDVCGDYSMPSVILASEQVKRCSSCKEISTIAELRHWKQNN